MNTLDFPEGEGVQGEEGTVPPALVCIACWKEVHDEHATALKIKSCQPDKIGFGIDRKHFNNNYL